MLFEFLNRNSSCCKATLLAAGLLFGAVGCGSSGSDPIADSGTNQIANEGTVVQLDASASRGINSVTYLWQQVSGPAVTLSSTTIARPVFTTPIVNGRTNLRFQVVVTTGGDSSTSDVVVTVNDAPTADAGADQIVDELSTVMLDGGASSDSDGSLTGFSWEQTSGPAVSLSTPNEFSSSFTAPDVEEAETLIFQLTVTDNNRASASDSVEVLVRPGILPVVIGSEVEFDRPAELSTADLLALPTGFLGRPLLVEGPRLSAVVNLDDRDEVEGLARCLSLVKACTSPPDRSVDDCMRSAPVCTTNTGWDEPGACCPAACFDSYEAQRLNGVGVNRAFMATFFSSTSCVDAVRDVEFSP